VEGLIGREWVKFSDLVAILANFAEEEFLASAEGPYLLEVPLEQAPEGDPRASLAETATTLPALGSEAAQQKDRPTARGIGETQRIKRPGRGGREGEVENTRTFSVEELLSRRRTKAEPRILFLGGHPRTVFGRGNDCDVRVFGNAVSRRHVEIQRTGDGSWAVVDLGSRNGTLLDGRPLTSQLPVVLRDRPVLQIGDWRGVVLFPRALWQLAAQLRGKP
jgi:hypothetical protein